jgi:hypothetical protein
MLLKHESESVSLPCGKEHRMDKIKRLFDKRFEHWKIQLPGADVKARKRGSIQKNGWRISYRFGHKGAMGFLEFYAGHRMTNDTLNRIYEDGKTELVDAVQEFFVIDKPGAEQEMVENNRKFYNRVEKAGLMPHPEPPATERKSEKFAKSSSSRGGPRLRT